MRTSNHFTGHYCMKECILKRLLFKSGQNHERNVVSEQSDITQYMDLHAENVSKQ